MIDPAQDPSADPRTLTPADWRALLSPVEYAILREAATERAGTGRYLDDPGPGAFHCAGCGQKLYGAAHKFHSGCGWPSFFQQIEPGALTEITDRSHGMTRTEMRCSRCDGHLGHIFADAPRTPTGMRHCVNGYAIVHVPEGESVAAVFQRHRAEK
jgi:peptide-methionine (R)-S-oxide reductase